MDASISMLPVSNSLQKFSVFDGPNQLLLIASDKQEDEFHVMRIDRKTDIETRDFRLDEIIHEEI